MRTKDDQVGNKTANKDGKEGKKRAREKDRNRFAKKRSIFWLLAKLVFSHSYAN